MGVLSPDDVQSAWGRTLTDAEVEQVIGWIADAELLIKTRLGDLTLLDQDVLAYVVREAALERLRNPDGADEETESIDDYSHTRKWSSTKRVRIWPEWWEMLSPIAISGAFSTRPSFVVDTPTNAWLDWT